jgi:hypothetical protein
MIDTFCDDGRCGNGNRERRGTRPFHIYVNDEKGYHLSTLFAGNGPDDGLKGYTSTTVNVRLGAVIYTYNAEGRQLSLSIGVQN